MHSTNLLKYSPSSISSRVGAAAVKLGGAPGGGGGGGGPAAAAGVCGTARRILGGEMEKSVQSVLITLRLMSESCD